MADRATDPSLPPTPPAENARRRLPLAEIVRFGASSAASAVISLGLPVLLHEVAGLSVQLSVAISQVSMLAINYLMLRTFVFRSSGRVAGEAAGYLASAAIFRGLEYVAFLGLYDLAELPYFPALVAVLIVSTLVKFVWYRLVFNRASAR